MSRSANEFPGEKMGTELGLNGWADLVKQKGRRGCSKGEEKHAQKIKDREQL